MKSFSPILEPMPGPGDEPSFADVLRDGLALFRRHLPLMLLLGALLAVVALFATTRMDRYYRSSVLLMIERPAASPIDVERPALGIADAGYVDGQILLIQSDDTLMRVIERAQLLDEPAFQPRPPSYVQQLVTYLKSFVPDTRPPVQLPSDAPDPRMLSALKVLSEAVTVFREGDTNVVSIDVQATSPALAQRIARTVADTYVELRLQQRQREADRLSGWIDARAEDLRAKLTEAEQAVTRYRIENNLVGNPEGVSLNEQQLTELNAELIRSRAELAEKRASYDLARQVLQGNGDPGNLPEVHNSPLIMTLRETQLELQRRAQSVSQIGGGNSPRLQQINRELESVNRQLGEEVLRIAEVLANETEALESRTRLLSQALDAAGGQSGLETQSVLRLNELERVAEALRLRYERYLNSAELATELSTFSTSGVEVVSAASLPLLPFYPPTKVIVILSFLLGVVLGLIGGLARDALRRDFVSAEDIERSTGLRVLAMFPQIDNSDDIPDVVLREPFSMYSEAVSVLRQNLNLWQGNSEAGRGAPAVLFTSAGENTGKTSLAASLAVVASTSRDRVLLVDADLRYAGLSELYDMDGGDGLCDILRGRSWSPMDPALPSGLDIMPAGDLRGKQPAEFLASANFRKFMSLARRSYDLVIVDGPPVANLADSAILAEQCSDVVTVMRYGEMMRDTLKEALKRLPRQNMSGAVVNMVDVRDTSGNWNFGHSYSSNYARSARLYQQHEATRTRADRKRAPERTGSA